MSDRSEIQQTRVAVKNRAHDDAGVCPDARGAVGGTEGGMGTCSICRCAGCRGQTHGGPPRKPVPDVGRRLEDDPAPGRRRHTHAGSHRKPGTRSLHDDAVVKVTLGARRTSVSRRHLGPAGLRPDERPSSKRVAHGPKSRCRDKGEAGEAANPAVADGDTCVTATLPSEVTSMCNRSLCT